MKLLIFFLMGITIIGFILVFPTSSFMAEGSPQPEILVQQAIIVSPEVYRIIKCESQWVETAIGDNGRAYGLAQFHRPTWDWLLRLSGKDLNYYNSQHQIELLTWALENGRGYLWSCYEI